MGLFSKKIDAKGRLLGETKLNDKSPLGPVDAMSFYTRILTDKLSNGHSSRNNPETAMDDALQDNSYFYASNRIFTNKGIKQPIFVEVFPDFVSVGWVDYVRDMLANKADDFNRRNNTNLSTHVMLNTQGDYFNFTYTDRRIQGRWKQLARLHQRLERESENRSLEDELNTTKYDDDVRQKVQSYLYLKSQKDVKRSGFYTTVVVLEIEILTGLNDSLQMADSLLEVLIGELNDFGKQEGFKFDQLFLQANEYQKSFSPTAEIGRKSLLKDFHKGDLFPVEVPASFSSVEQGKVGDDKGMFFGMDIQTHEPIFFNLGEGSDANNILLTAATGQGKSGYSKMLYTFLARDPLYQTVIFDYEGHEYEPLGNLNGALSVSFSSDSGSYINTLVIPEEIGVEEVDKARLNNAKQSTERIFNVLFSVNGQEGMNKEEQGIFSALLSATYKRAGVVEKDPSTWARNSKDLTLYSLYVTLNDFINSRNGTADIDIKTLGGEEQLRNFKLVTSSYFDTNGSKAYWFKNPVSVQEVMEARSVRFAFDGSGSSGTYDATEQQQLMLRQMFAGELTLAKARRNLSKHVRTVVFIEEIQRYFKLKYSKQMVANFVTGGRKLGMINFLITNSPLDLLQEERMGGIEDNSVANIMGNLTMQIIGGLDPDNMRAVIAKFGLENAAGYLSQLVAVATNGTKNSPMRYTFFLNKGNQSTMVKQVIHPDLADLPLYETVPKGSAQDDLRQATEMDKEDVDKRILDVFTDYTQSDDKTKTLDDLINRSGFTETAGDRNNSTYNSRGNDLYNPYEN